MTLKEQIMILEYWGYKNSDMAELLQHKHSIIATMSWQIRNRERHNFNNIMSYARNRENNNRKQREAYKKYTKEQRKEQYYRRKCREAGVEYPCREKSMSPHRGEINTKTASLEP